MSQERTKLTDFNEELLKLEKQWLDDNLPIFQKACMDGYEELGRGALMVNTNSTNDKLGHPFWYMKQAIIEDLNLDDLANAIRSYDPFKEIVLSVISYTLQPKMHILRAVE